MKVLEGQSRLTISDGLFETMEKLRDIAEADAQTLARWKASEELEHAAIAYGEAVHTDEYTSSIEEKSEALEDVAIRYHAACIDTGEGDSLKEAAALTSKIIAHTERLMGDDECPNCESGTLEDNGDELVCRGECGEIFSKNTGGAE